MDTTEEIRTRFREAFARYAAADTRLRVLRAKLLVNADSHSIHDINAHFGLLVTAEHDYQAIRLEYIDRLLLPAGKPGGPVTKIYVRNLEPEATEKSVRSLFETYGDVQRIRMRVRHNTAQPGSFAFIEMPDGDANDAIRALHGRTLGSQILHVIKARPARSASKEAAD